MVKEFHEKFTHTNNKFPTLIPKELSDFRRVLLNEELNEIDEGFANNDLVEIADGLGDALYVLFGTCCTLGIDIEPIFEEIHRSNMSKDYSGSNCRKQIKGKNYFKPNIKKEIDKQVEKYEKSIFNNRNSGI
jgi:predicted HAD superfamily Cof-like phosphohydrolase